MVSVHLSSCLFIYAQAYERALKPPGFVKDWHIGVRVATTKKLVAFIAGVPMNLRIRDTYVISSLCAL